MRLKIIVSEDPKEVEEEYNKIHEKVKFSQSQMLLKGGNVVFAEFCLLADEVKNG